jgi:hypothetical protein
LPSNVMPQRLDTAISTSPSRVLSPTPITCATPAVRADSHCVLEDCPQARPQPEGSQLSCGFFPVAVVIPEGLASLDADRLRPPVHTVIALKESENSLAPQYLGRIIRHLRAACDFGDVESLIATHAPTVLRRVDPLRSASCG